MFITYLAVLCGFQAPPGRLSRKFPVVHSERETPLPIPNRAVKPFSADGTWGATPWESRSPPVLLSASPTKAVGLVACLCRFAGENGVAVGHRGRDRRSSPGCGRPSARRTAAARSRH